jgi:two-component system cell cycle sensor histidine kinase/response regulator CckA
MLSKHTTPTMSVVLQVLLITFISENLVMLLLPHLLPDRAGTAIGGLTNAALLTVLVFPFLWLIIRHNAARNRMENKQLRNENRLRTIIETVPECAILLAEDGTILDMNRAGLAMIAADSAAQAVGTSIFPLIVPDYRAAFQEVLDEVFRGNAGAIEYEFIGMKGSRRWIETRSAPLKDENGKITMLLGICRDITEQKKLEAQMRHSQKMDAIGTLSGGIAHDFNNILTAIIGYSNILKLKLKQDDPARPFVDQILASSERATGLTQSLLAFSRRTATNLKPVNLNETVQRADKLIRRIIGESIELKTNLADGATTVVADAGQIEQVLMNLATNARDSMPDGGTLTLSSGVTEIGNDFIRTYGYGKPGTYFVFVVTDTGTGMDDKIRDRIFEPFFTTKEVGKGTGLGLSIVYGIVKTHNGYINCSSKPGHGTTFTIYLPLANPSSCERKASLSQVPTGGTETILLAEDDPEVRTLSTTFLRDFGYTIIDAENGEDACRRFRENRDDISLLLFDVIMPKKDGKEAYDEIKRLSPDIKILFMSGYNTATIAKKGITREGLKCILKPVSPEVLLKKVREVLDT